MALHSQSLKHCFSEPRRISHVYYKMLSNYLSVLKILLTQNFVHINRCGHKIDYISHEFLITPKQVIYNNHADFLLQSEIQEPC